MTTHLICAGHFALRKSHRTFGFMRATRCYSVLLRIVTHYANLRNVYIYTDHFISPDSNSPRTSFRRFVGRIINKFSNNSAARVARKVGIFIPFAQKRYAPGGSRLLQAAAAPHNSLRLGTAVCVSSLETAAITLRLQKACASVFLSRCAFYNKHIRTVRRVPSARSFPRCCASSTISLGGRENPSLRFPRAVKLTAYVQKRLTH